MRPLPPDKEIDIRLRAELRPLAHRLRSRRFHARSACVWGAVAAALGLVLALCVATGANSGTTLASLAAVALLGGLWLALLQVLRPGDGDYRAAAGWIERQHPDLRHALATALEQRAGRDRVYSFLQRQVIREALAHARTHDWENVPLPRSRVLRIAHIGALAAVCGVFVVAALLPRTEDGTIVLRQELQVAVTPGDIEVERGAVVIVAARFTDGMPASAALAWGSPAGVEARIPMARSLSDPVFTATLPPLREAVSYHVEYDGAVTRPFQIGVYDLPALSRADARLDYPGYTGLAARRIEDTKRVSAVEGTMVEYEFHTNKPVRSAVLREASGEEVALEAGNTERTRFIARFPLERSLRFALQLEDYAGRTNAWPDDIRLEAVPNRPPELRIVFPRGDQRISALEELRIEAEASDDFGILDYGLGFAIGNENPELLSLRSGSGREFNAAFGKLVSLEPRRLQPDDLVTWFAWARDHGPDGAERLASSDLFFGEVRPFDEIFVEQEGGEQQSQQGHPGGGSQGEQLLETQRQISLALWKLRHERGADGTFVEDIGTLAEAQREARRQLEDMRRRLEDERLRAAAGAAADLMDETQETLESIKDTLATDSLDSAWRSSQGAYQALLRMQPRETRVAQARAGQAGQGGSSRNQRQLNQLRFRSDDDPYATASTAQALTSEEEREQLQTLSRLRELARRQQDLNRRLQELQTALVAARDASERERIERELKRLEEEQRRMVANLDEVRQRLDRRSREPGARDALQQLDRTREDMRRSSEALGDGAVSEALASGTRAQENLDRARDDLRRESSSRFADDLREARRAARDLAQEQQEIAEEIDHLETGGQRRLDDTEQRRGIAQRMEENRRQLGSLIEALRRVTEESDGAEPGLHQQLYDLLREQGQGLTSDRMDNAAELVRRGFLNQARELQPEIERGLDRLRRGIERAAESVLGDEISTMRFAQNELDDLSQSLGRERGDASGRAGDPRDDSSESALALQPPGEARHRGDSPASAQDRESSPGPPAGDVAGSPPGERTRPAPGGTGMEELSEALDAMIGEAEGSAGRGGGAGPITGADFAEWSERLRTVESLLEFPGARERLTGAREQAEALRAEFRRHGNPPQWKVVESGIAAPLSEVRTWLREEIARRDDPTALQPVDRDQVPDTYAEAVKRYYESLGR